MPLPFLAAGGLAAVLTTALRWLFLAHLGAFVFRLFAVLGLTWVTNEMIVEEIIDMIQGSTQGVPSKLAEWMSAFGFDVVISVIASAYTLLGVKRVFLGKSS